jgi:hypothetical protein
MPNFKTPTVVLASEKGYLSISALDGVEKSNTWDDFFDAMRKLADSQGWKWEQLDGGSQLNFYVPDGNRDGFRDQLHEHLQSVCRQTGWRFHTVFVQRMTTK